MSRTGSLWLHRLRQAPLLAAAVAWLAIPGTSMSATSPPDAPGVSTYGNHRAQGLAFEPNHGQSDEQVRFIARGRDYTVFLTATEAVLAPIGRPTQTDSARPSYE